MTVLVLWHQTQRLQNPGTYKDFSDRVSMSESLSQIDCKAPVPSSAPSFKLATRSENTTDQYEPDPSHNINLRMRLQLKTCSGVYRRHLADVLVGSMPMVSWCEMTTPFQQCWKEGS